MSETTGAACIPCQFGCADIPPPEHMRPIRCPDCGRLWKKTEPAELMVQVLGNCVDTEDGGPWCPHVAIRMLTGVSATPECDGCLVYEVGDDFSECTCCWRAFANGEPMPVDAMNALLPAWVREQDDDDED